MISCECVSQPIATKLCSYTFKRAIMYLKYVAIAIVMYIRNQLVNHILIALCKTGIVPATFTTYLSNCDISNVKQ